MSGGLYGVGRRGGRAVMRDPSMQIKRREREQGAGFDQTVTRDGRRAEVIPPHAWSGQ
jgi:hypothetical protein